MIRVAVFCLTWFGLGVIAAEIFNNFELVEERINVLYIAVPASLLYLLSETVLVVFKKRAGRSQKDELRYRMILRQYHLILGLIGFIAIFVIPFVWWGVMEKLAGLAGEGVRTF